MYFSTTSWDVSDDLRTVKMKETAIQKNSENRIHLLSTYCVQGQEFGGKEYLRNS